MGLFGLFKKKTTKSKVDNNIKTIPKKVEHKGIQYPQSKNGMYCETCGKPLRAFHYYRDNVCWTYCEECGNPHQACYASPYRTIELMFSGIQREGICLTLEIKKYPSLEHSHLRWYEWSFGGGYEEKISLPPNYISEHTVDEFINDYIKKPNKLIRRIHNHNSEDFLNRTRIILTESGIFKQIVNADEKTILLEIHDVVSKFNAKFSQNKIDFDKVFIGECVNMPGCVGCYWKEEGWYLYRVDDRFNLLQNGPFSLNGIIVALLHMLYIPAEMQNREFDDEEYKLFLRGEKPV